MIQMVRGRLNQGESVRIGRLQVAYGGKGSAARCGQAVIWVDGDGRFDAWPEAGQIVEIIRSPAPPAPVKGAAAKGAAAEGAQP